MNTRRLIEQDVDGLLVLYHHLHTDDDPIPHRSIVDAVWDEISVAGFTLIPRTVESRSISSFWVTSCIA